MMKKKILIYVLLGLLTSCIAQKNKEKSIKKDIMIPKLDRNFEMFDLNRYNRLQALNPYLVKELMTNGNYLEMFKSDAGLGIYETLSNSYFQISKVYYKNGYIKAKGVEFNGYAFNMGIWYEFDESGKLIKETDYDKPYKFTFDDIVKFCENEKILLQKGPILQNTGYHTVIRRDHNAESSWWQIEWLKKPNVIEIIKLDGNTGKILKRQDTDYTNN